MNLTDFLKQTDDIIAKCSKEQLILFIHDTGRILPEQYRGDFLRRLKAAGGRTEELVQEDEDKPDFDERYQLVRNRLEKIDSQEVTLDGILNEEYDDWYNDGEEFYYEDNNGISDILKGACEFVHICMDMERYEEGFAVGSQMASMKILCTSEYGDEEFNLGDMVYHKLMDCDLMQVFLDTAFCAYHAVPLEKRPEALYSVIVNVRRDKITFEAIMQHGDEELHDFQDFLTLWIAYLGTKTGSNADRLIGEAVSLLNDTAAAAGYAKKYADVHPGLYLNILENGKCADAQNLIAIGMEAMKILPKKYIVRSWVALETAEYIIREGEEALLSGRAEGQAGMASAKELEQCYFTAYESDTAAVNYLRALLGGYGNEKGREELRKVFMELSVNKDDGLYLHGENHPAYGRGTYFEREENKPGRNMILLLRFLDGQFADVLEEGLNKSEALGWSGSFMKQGIALYLLYLYEGQWNGKGIIEMADIVKNTMHFSPEEYRKGTCERESTNDGDSFYNVFSEWKAMVQMEPDIRTYALNKITGLLEKRVEGIMGANRRNYYGECAAYIAALGEVRESMGEMNAKQRLMTSYRDAYSRRSAFREEMRKYGWIDVKRK